MMARLVLHVRAEDSPNVKRALLLKARHPGLTVSQLDAASAVLPGCLSYGEYVHRRQTWDAKRQCIGLDGEFYVGADVMLFPSEWLARSKRRAQELEASNVRRIARAIGCDPAEGGDKTAFCVIDGEGVLELLARQTPDTTIITSECVRLMRKWDVPPERVCFDRGSGKAHADRLRSQGHDVRTVGFGEAVALEPKRGLVLLETRLDNREERYAYVNRRAQMYHELAELLDPEGDPVSSSRKSFAVPARMEALFEQMAPLPKDTDQEGRYKLLPKHKKNADDQTPNMTDLIGHSPDELDALVLAVHAMLHKRSRARVVVG